MISLLGSLYFLHVKILVKCQALVGAVFPQHDISGF